MFELPTGQRFKTLSTCQFPKPTANHPKCQKQEASKAAKKLLKAQA